MPARLSTLGLAAVTAAALLAAAGCGLVDRHTTSTTEAYDVSGEIDSIHVNGEAGTVEIVATGDGVRVTERREYTGTSPKTSHRTEGGTLYLVDKGCDAQFRIRKSCETNYRVEAPAGTAVKIEVDTAEVTITDITGPIDLTTDVGTIKGTGLAGATRVRSDVGDVDLRFGTAPASVDATNDVGSTTVYLPSGAAYRFDVDVDLGDSTIALPSRPDADHRIKLSANIGDVTVQAA